MGANLADWRGELPRVLGSLEIRAAEDRRWRENRVVAVHSHPWYQFDYFYEGFGEVAVGDTTYAVAPGDLFGANPGDEHGFVAAANHPMEGISFKFYLRDFESALPARVGNLGLLARSQQLELERYLRQACLEFNSRLEGSSHLAVCLFSAFVVLLIRYLRDVERFAGSGSPAQRYGRVMGYIERHYARTATLADLARVAGVHPKYLARKFREEFGLSPMAALALERVKAAKHLLLYTKLPIAEVGVRVGYPDPYHFSRRFKEIAGMAPADFRKQYLRFR